WYSTRLVYAWEHARYPRAYEREHAAMTSPSPEHLVAYRTAGVDTEREEIALQRLIKKIRPTWAFGAGIGSVRLDIGYFANVLDIGGIGLGISTDGVGTEVIIGQREGMCDTLGVDM